MIIEVYLNGKRIRREFFELPDPNPALSFKQRFEEREKTIKRVLNDFKANVLNKLQRESTSIEFALVFESKMNPSETPKAVKLPQPFRDIDKPRIVLPDLEPVKWVRPKAEYSNARGYDY